MIEQMPHSAKPLTKEIQTMDLTLFLFQCGSMFKTLELSKQFIQEEKWGLTTLYGKQE